MNIEILGRNPHGTCDLTGKSELEVWSVRAGGGELQNISTQRLPEVLRVLARVGNGKPPQPVPMKPSSP
ncbi:MAG: hypothetical protein R3C01_02195 [Planctomycetaceae bacterium]